MLDHPQSIPIFLSFLGSVISVVLYHRKQFQNNSQAQMKIEQANAEQKRLSILQEKNERVQKIEEKHIKRKEKKEKEKQAFFKSIDEEESRLEQSLKLIEEREQILSQRNLDIVEKENQLKNKQEQFKGLQRDLNQGLIKVKKQLEEKTGSSVKQITLDLQNQISEQVELESQKRNQVHISDVELHQDQVAQKMLSVTCQRYHLPPFSIEKMTASVDLPHSEKQKLKLLDSNGALLQEISSLAQVDFQLELENQKISLRNAPESYTREVAKVSYEKWVEGGTLTSQAFKTIYQKTSKLIEKQVHRAGLDAAACLGLKGIHPDILNLVGKLLYRTSYTQNQWQHAIESAQLASMLAEELGMNPVMARRATLLHDIGKVLWEETEAAGSHAVSGAAFAKDHGEIPEIVHPIAAHHNDEAPKTPLAFLVIAADTLSGARPGARTETAESFSQHVEMLDKLCLEYDGVKGHLIIQGGRELRMFLDPKRYDDQAAAALTQVLASKIEDESVYPGQVKVMALREVYGSAIARAPYANTYDHGYHYGQ
jgi:ribonuclease Y